MAASEGEYSNTVRPGTPAALKVSAMEAAFFALASKRRTNAMSERIPMTRAGYNKIKAELYVLENEQMPEIEKRIATARAEGDLSENAEYHGARESQGMLQAKINLLRDKLARSMIMDNTKIPKDQVAFGCTIVVKDLDFGDTTRQQAHQCARRALNGGIGRGRHAQTDQEPAIAHRANPRIAPGPAEALSAELVTLHQ